MAVFSVLSADFFEVPLLVRLSDSLVMLLVIFPPLALTLSIALIALLILLLISLRMALSVELPARLLGWLLAV